MLDAVKNEIERESFRAHIGRQIQCQGCRGVLDVRRAVAAYVWLPYTRGILVENELVGCMALCGKCFDKAEKRGNFKRALQLAGEGSYLETFDGRERW